MKQLIAYCDGGSRGNPGPSACAYAVYCGDDLLHSEAFYLGSDKTNNFAEFTGLIKLLEFLYGRMIAGNPNDPLDVRPARVLIFCDSTLVVNTVNGDWNCKHENLKPLCAYAQGLKTRGQHTLQHCKGHDGIIGNELCDQLVNRCLDENS